MSRNRNLYELLNNDANENWVSGLFIDNMPQTLLANEYIMQTAIIVNSVLLTSLVHSEDKLAKYDITNNK